MQQRDLSEGAKQPLRRLKILGNLTSRRTHENRLEFKKRSMQARRTACAGQTCDNSQAAEGHHVLDKKWNSCVLARKHRILSEGS